MSRPSSTHINSSILIALTIGLVLQPISLAFDVSNLYKSQNRASVQALDPVQTPNTEEQVQAYPLVSEGVDPKKEKAVENYNQGVELFQAAQIHADRGDMATQKKLLREAIKTFKVAAALDKSRADAQSNIGFCFLTLKNYKLAISAFNDALQIDPNHLNTLNALATTYAFNGSNEKAITTFEKLTLLEPANADYWFNKGSVLQKANRNDEAIVAYTQAAEIDPKHQRAWFNLGTLHENLGQLDKAKQNYEHAKDVEVGNSIGLEAINRLQDLAVRLNNNAGPATSDALTP